MLVVPVCGESKDFLSQLTQNQQVRNVLVVMIINRPEGHCKSEQWRSENDVLVNHLSSQYSESINISAGHQLLKKPSSNKALCDVLLLNFNTVVFDPSKGVGLARRIAADTALSLIERHVIKTPWIYSTDADVVLPDNYFVTVGNLPPNTSALSLRFIHHSADSLQNELQQKYDFKLAYYQSGVSFVGAKYAYIPLGSTLVIEAASYAKVRGFPCKSGGEDFYILNKLAKVGDIYQPQQPSLSIQSRFSDRVPFGTGPAISHILQQLQAGEDITYYHPRIFHILKSWRVGLLDYYHTKHLPKNDSGLNQHWDIEVILQKCLIQIRSEPRWHQFVHEWFDAFKILKSVHFLRTEFKSLPMPELLESDAYRSLSF